MTTKSMVENTWAEGIGKFLEIKKTWKLTIENKHYCIVFNKTCLNNSLRKYITFKKYIYTYVRVRERARVCVCVCMCDG